MTTIEALAEMMAKFELLQAMTDAELDAFIADTAGVVGIEIQRRWAIGIRERRS